MKDKSIKIVLFLFVAIEFVGCMTEDLFQSKHYPFIVTNEATKIDESGVTLNGTIVDLGSEKIIDYGFLWGNVELSLKNNTINEYFSFRLTSDIDKGSTYKYRAYAKIENKTVLGDEVTFVSKGSEKPIITDFYPKEGFDGDTITLKGQNFSYDPKRNIVFVDDYPVEIISSTINSLVFKIPSSNIIGDAIIKFQMGSNSIFTNDKLKILAHQISSVSILNGNRGDIIRIYGTNFIKNGTKLDVLICDEPAEVIESSNTMIKLILPIQTTYQNDLGKDIVGKIKVTCNGLKSVYYKDNFTLIDPWRRKQETPFSWIDNYVGTSNNVNGYIYDGRTSLYKYDPTIDNWSVISDVFPGATVMRGIFYVSNNNFYKVGGERFYPSGLINEVWSYNLSNNSWLQKQSIPFQVEDNVHGCHFALNGTDYVISWDGQLWKCDFDKGSFIQLNNFPISFKYFNSFSFPYIIDNTAYVVTSGITYKYIESNDTWIEEAPNTFVDKDNTVGFTLTGFILKNEIYIFDNPYLYKYYPDDKKWRPIYYIPYYNFYEHSTSFVIGNTAYIVLTETHRSSDSDASMYSFTKK